MDSWHNRRPPLAVAFEPSLRPRSPENGNIFENGRRLSAIWPAKKAQREARDRRPNAKARRWRPFLAPLGNRHEGRTAWLGREGSNLRMAESKSDDSASDLNENSEFSQSVRPLKAFNNSRR